MEGKEGNVKSLMKDGWMMVWSLGNECGYGMKLEKRYEWVKGYDESGGVEYEGGGYESKRDIDWGMYMEYEESEKYWKSDGVKGYMECEYGDGMGK